MHRLRTLAPLLILTAVLMAFAGVSAAIEGEGDDPPVVVEPTTDAAECPLEADGSAEDQDGTDVVESDDEGADDSCAEDTDEEGDGEDVTDVTEAPDADDDSADEGPEAAANHGTAVSEAAHTCPAGPDHGACVREVAQSDVGKPHTDSTDADETPAADHGPGNRSHGRP